MLTKSFLLSAKSELQFATGITHDERLWKDPVRWVAVRGDGYPDWCIYYHLSENTAEWVAQHGDKIFTKEIIRDLVPCDDEALSMYRK